MDLFKCNVKRYKEGHNKYAMGNRWVLMRCIFTVCSCKKMNYTNHLQDVISKYSYWFIDGSKWLQNYLQYTRFKLHLIIATHSY